MVKAVKAKPIEESYVKEFVEYRNKVKRAHDACEEDLNRMVKDLTVKYMAFYMKGFQNAFKDYDGTMKYSDFLQMQHVKGTTVANTITINSKNPRAPRPEETLYSVDGTPIRM